jgi:hypothetical protein
MGTKIIKQKEGTHSCHCIMIEHGRETEPDLIMKYC